MKPLWPSRRVYALPVQDHRPRNQGTKDAGYGEGGENEVLGKDVEGGSADDGHRLRDDERGARAKDRGAERQERVRFDCQPKLRNTADGLNSVGKLDGDEQPQGPNGPALRAWKRRRERHSHSLAHVERTRGQASCRCARGKYPLSAREVCPEAAIGL